VTTIFCANCEKNIICFIVFNHDNMPFAQVVKYINIICDKFISVSVEGD
jgi:hypothetical protein